MRAPLVIGSLALCAVTVLLLVEDPSPGALAKPHAGLGLEKFDACGRCHAPGGITDGCLGCHAEIATQLRGGTGFHAAASECAGCHPEHHGESFDITHEIAWRTTPREEFDHAHVAFDLHGAHDGLACEDCHGLAETPTLPAFPDRPREATALGLDQTCATCHRNVHGSSRYDACAECHGQETFKPAKGFDHAEFLSLENGHRVACDRCHGKEFRDVKGKLCADCHETPHRAWRELDCQRCHGAATEPWARASFAPADHAATGFRLDPPHERVTCEACHAATAPYAERFPGTRAADRCDDCHEDVHAGQFGGRRCTECHDATRFEPSAFGRAQHVTFALRGAHATAGCRTCHGRAREEEPRRFTGTPRDCRGCHEDEHRGQFTQDCDACHTETEFLPARFDLAAHDAFPLAGAHGAVACTACHEQDATLGARRFAGTPTDCRDCHADPHGVQFAAETKAKGCAGCHGPDTFRIRPFDHARRTGHRLRGAHAKADCVQCHAVVKRVRRYRPTPTRCADCHSDAHRGQLGARDEVSCDRCHVSTDRWSADAFDHGRHTRFPLDRTHKAVACADCHPVATQRDGSRVVQYRPLGRRCGDCHEVEKR